MHGSQSSDKAEFAFCFDSHCSGLVNLDALMGYITVCQYLLIDMKISLVESMHLLALRFVLLGNGNCFRFLPF